MRRPSRTPAIAADEERKRRRRSTGRARSSFLLVCVALSLGGCAHSAAEARRSARAVGSATWLELHAERFTLVTDGSRAALETYARDLSRFIAVVDEVVSAPPAKTPARFFLLSDATQAVFIDPSLGGYIFPSLSGFHSFVRADEHSPVDRHVLLHEFTHYLTLRNNSLSYPDWYVEGLAEFLGSTRTREDTMEVGAAPPGRIAALELLRARGGPFEISHVLAHGQVPGADEAPLDYASAWALVHYLHTSRERKSQLYRFLQLQIAGHSWDDAFARAFSESPERLAEKIEAHTRRIARGAPDSLLYLDLDRLDVDSKWTVRALTRPEVGILLGETAMLARRHALSEALFRDAMEHAPGDPRARTALIAAVAAQGRFEAAREMAAQIDEATLSESQSLCHLASALYEEADSMKPSDAETPASARDALFERAKSLFERATRDDPLSPVAWAGLGRSRNATGDAEGAIKAFEMAWETGEGDVELVLDWGLAEMRAGRETSARIKWNTVLRRGNEAQRERAARLIAELPGLDEKERTEDSPP